MRTFLWSGLLSLVAANAGMAQGTTTGTGTTGTGTTGTGSSGGGLGGTLGNPSLTATPNISAQAPTTATSSVVNQSNVLGAYYANPYYQGRAGSTSSTTPGGFGTALYGTAGAGASTTGGRTGAIGGRTGTTTGLGGATGFGSTGATGGFGTTGGFGGTTGSQSGIVVPLPRQISYTATLNFPRPSIAPTQMQANLQGVLLNSSMLANSRNITLSMDGGTVVLRGSAATADDARLAENMIRLTPGVREVRNELTFPVQPQPQP